MVFIVVVIVVVVVVVKFLFGKDIGLIDLLVSTNQVTFDLTRNISSHCTIIDTKLHVVRIKKYLFLISPCVRAIE